VSFLIVLILVLVVMYVLLIRPQRRRQQEHQTMIDRASVGEDVLTTGGIYGTVTQAEGDDLVVEIADGVKVHMTRRGIAAVLPPEHEEAAADDDIVDADDVDGGDAGEGPVMRGEDDVTHEVDAETAAAERR
jgi:preprotein translocase subunit YajC